MDDEMMSLLRRETCNITGHERFEDPADVRQEEDLKEPTSLSCLTVLQRHGMCAVCFVSKRGQQQERNVLLLLPLFWQRQQRTQLQRSDLRSVLTAKEQEYESEQSERQRRSSVSNAARSAHHLLSPPALAAAACSDGCEP